MTSEPHWRVASVHWSEFASDKAVPLGECPVMGRDVRSGSDNWPWLSDSGEPVLPSSQYGYCPLPEPWEIVKVREILRQRGTAANVMPLAPLTLVWR